MAKIVINIDMDELTSGVNQVVDDGYVMMKRRRTSFVLFPLKILKSIR